MHSSIQRARLLMRFGGGGLQGRFLPYKRPFGISVSSDTCNSVFKHYLRPPGHDQSQSMIAQSAFGFHRLFSVSATSIKSNKCKNAHTNGATGSQNRSTTALPINQRAAKEILKQLRSPPNILTLSRIMATPYLSFLLISHHHEKLGAEYNLSAVDSTTIDVTSSASTDLLTNMDLTSTPVMALSLFLVMGFTDFLDGYIARNFDCSTVLGTYLDPFADKVFISTMSMTLWYTNTLPGALVGLWVVRDIGMFSTAYWMVRTETLEKRKSSNDDNKEPIAIMDPTNTPLKVEANFLSKVNTALQIGLIALGIAIEVPSIEIPSELMTGLW